MDTTQHDGILASLEGISGCGKTYFVAKLQAALKETPTTFIKEVTNRQGNGLDLRIITLLSNSEDRFFRMGVPRTETFLLLALKMYDYEALISPTLAQGGIAIEDRSLDTIAVYQSILLWPHNQERWLETANMIYDQATHWRRPPDITFLLEDDFDMALVRAQQRSKRTFNSDEVAILRNAATLYDAYADYHQPRIMRLDRRSMSDDAIIQAIRDAFFVKQRAE